MKMNLSSTMVSFGILLALGKLLLKVKNKVEKEVCPLLYVIYFFPRCFGISYGMQTKKKEEKSTLVLED